MATTQRLLRFLPPGPIIREVQALAADQPKLTQAEIADLLGVSKAVVSRMLSETRTSTPRINYRQRTLRKIAYALTPRRNAKIARTAPKAEKEELQPQETGPAEPPRHETTRPATHVAPSDNVAENAAQKPEIHTSPYANRDENRALTPQLDLPLTDASVERLEMALKQARYARDIALQACELANDDVADLKKTINELRSRESVLMQENHNLRKALFDALRSSLNATTTNPGDINAPHQGE